MRVRGLDWLLLKLLPRVGSLWLKILGWSMRLEYRGFEILEALSKRGENGIFAFWHGRQLMLPTAYPNIHQGRKLAILISLHRDGEYISRIIKRFGMDSVRGSTYKGAFRGLKQLVRALKQGFDVGITPDGPRGPKYKAQMGAIQLAKLSGAPIIPLTFGATKKKPSPAGII